jgi:hypothetical protein
VRGSGFWFGFALRRVALFRAVHVRLRLVLFPAGIFLRLSVATRAAGRVPMRGLARPSTEMVNACFAPCVCVWGFWFGFALRSLAVWRVCAIAPSLFPAGGPFLPSLSVNLYCIGFFWLSVVACLAVALADVCVWILSRVGVWVCLVWLAFFCVWPRLFAFRRPCC